MALTFGLALHGEIDLASLTRSIVGTGRFLVVSFPSGAGWCSG
jgi:hypothetical protein